MKIFADEDSGRGDASLALLQGIWNHIPPACGTPFPDGKNDNAHRMADPLPQKVHPKLNQRTNKVQWKPSPDTKQEFGMGDFLTPQNATDGIQPPRDSWVATTNDEEQGRLGFTCRVGVGMGLLGGLTRHLHAAR